MVFCQVGLEVVFLLEVFCKIKVSKPPQDGLMQMLKYEKKMKIAIVMKKSVKTKLFYTKILTKPSAPAEAT